MGVIKRCEIKRHAPFTGDACPECKSIQQNGLVAGLLVSGFILASGAVAWLVLAKKFSLWW